MKRVFQPYIQFLVLILCVFPGGQAKAQSTVDNAQMRYFVVHIHRLMEPDQDHHH